jgi:transcription-repair coupling factor (superfamily II helicase)
MFVVRLRYLCTNTGFKKAQIKGNNLTIEFPTENPVYYEKIFPLLLDYINTLELDNLKFRQAKSKLTLNYDFKEKNEVVEFLWKLKKIIGLSIEN